MITVVCLHHAGGRGSAFEGWRRAAPPGVRVLALDLPVRPDAPARRRLRTVEDVVPVLLDELTDRVDGRFVLFGHSMGGLLAYLLARRLVDGGGPVPDGLAVAAVGAPHLPLPRLSLPADDDSAIRMLAWLGGVPGWAARHPEWLAPYLGLLRDDAAMCAGYRHRPQPGPLPVPVRAFGGNADPLVAVSDVRAWSTVAEDVRIHILPGNHFLDRDATLRDLVIAFAISQATSAAPADVASGPSTGETS